MHADKKLIIYGNGHMAKMLYQFIKGDFEVPAFTVDDSCIDVKTICDIPVIGFTAIEKAFPPETHNMLIAVGFSEMNCLRQRKYVEAKQKGYSFINYIHPSVNWHDSLAIGENNIVLDHASIHPFTRLGDNNFISSNTNIGHGCHIDNHCWINAGVSVGGESTIKNYAFLGINATISHNIVVATKTFIGANTLINRNTDSGGVYLSSPGEKFRLSSEQFLKFSSAL